MKRPEQHQIDELAQRVFKNKLPASWVVNEQTNDYGKDYLVEIANEENELTGTAFYVQLKGQKSVRQSKDRMHVKFSLESKYARYYAENIRDLPVFLVVVDTSVEGAWWLFLQNYLDDDQRWKRQQSFTIDLPTINKLDNSESVAKAVKNAQNWLRARHPTAIPDAINAYQCKLEKLDPRFRVSVSYRDGGTHALIEPRTEPVSVTLKLTGDTHMITQKMTDLIGRGKKVRLEDGEFEFEGSSLFTSYGPGPVEIQWASSHQGTATIVLFDEEKNEISRVSEIGGTYTGGVSELRFKSAPSKLPVCIETPALHESGGSLQLKFPLSVWDGSPILHLPYFDRAYAFFAAMVRCSYLKTEFHIDGNLLAEGKLSTFHMPKAESIEQLVASLSKARKVFRHANLNPIWSLSRFDEDFFDTVNLVHALLFEDGIRKPLPDHSFTIPIKRNTLNEDVLKEPPKPALLRLSSESKAVILDQEIQLGTVSDDYNDVMIQQVNPSESNGAVEIEIRTTASTIHSMYVVKECIDAPPSPATD